MASPARPDPHQPEAPPPPLSKLTDDIIAEILIRLPTLADLGRASAACPSFRRVIAGRSFLRRIRAVHPPPLLGTLAGHCGPDFLPAKPPHPSAAVARAFVDAADFSCSFLPSPDRWRYRDFRDGRALLSKLPEGRRLPPGNCDLRALVKNLTVCDLLHRRYLLLPAIPDRLAAANCRGIVRFEAFLAPSSDDEGGTSFRVICLAECLTNLVVFTFSSDGGQWHAAAFDDWSALTAGSANASTFSRTELSGGRDYAHRCFCWAMPRRNNKLLVLDALTMDFSTIDIPPADPWRRMAIVEAGEGRFGLFTVCLNREPGVCSCNLSYSILRNVQNAKRWQPEATIQLPLNYDLFNILGVAGGYLLLLGIPRSRYQVSVPIQERPNMDCFSLNLKTFQIEPFCETRNMIEDAPLFAGFSPSLSLPTI